MQIREEIKEKTKTRPSVAKKQHQVPSSTKAPTTLVIDPVVVSAALPKEQDHQVLEVVQVFKKRVERHK